MTFIEKLLLGYVIVQALAIILAWRESKWLRSLHDKDN